MLGIKSHGSRAIAIVRNDRKKLNKTFSDLLTLHLIISLIVFLLYIIFILLSTDEYKLYFIILVLMVLSAVFDINWFFAGIEQFKLTVTRSGLVKIGSVILTFALVKTENDLWLYILISAMGIFLSNAIIWAFLKKYVTFVKPSLSGIYTHIRPVFLLFISVLSISVYSNLNRIMLGNMAGEVQLGFYTNAQKIIGVVLSFIYAFNGVMIPRMSNVSNQGNLAEVKRLISLSTKYVMLLALAFAFGIAAIAKDFTPLFFGREFREAGYLLVGLSTMIPFIAFQNIISTQHLIPNQKDKEFTLAYIIGAVISIPLNLILIPIYQAMGVVITRVVVEVVICIIISIFARKDFSILLYLKNALFFFFAGMAMLLLVKLAGYYMGYNVMTLLLQITIGAIFYLGICGGYLYLTKDEFLLKNLKLLRRGK